MTDEQIPYQEIRARVEARFKRRSKLITDVLISIGLNIFAWGAWFATNPVERMPGTVMLLISAIIGLALINDIAGFLLGERQERAIDREIEREREHQRYMLEKPKRDENTRFVRLSDEGELEDLPDTERETDQLKQR